MPEPPTLDQSKSKSGSISTLSTASITFELHNDVIVVLDTNEIIFELSQAPFSGNGSALAIQRISYKANQSGSLEAPVRSRKTHIYDVKDIMCCHPAMKPRNALEVTSEGGSQSCIKGPAAIVKGKPFPLFRYLNYGESWHIGTIESDSVFISSFETRKGREFRNSSRTVIAFTKQDSSRIQTVVQVDDKTLNALVTLWCGAIWFECRKKRQAQNVLEYSKFGKCSLVQTRSIY